MTKDKEVMTEGKEVYVVSLYINQLCHLNKKIKKSDFCRLRRLINVMKDLDMEPTNEE